MVDVFSEQHLCTLPQVADSMSAVCRSMGFRSKTEQTRVSDFVSLSNDSMSTRGKRSQTVQCCWRSSRALEVYRRIGSPARNQATSRPVIERPLEGTSMELDTASRMRRIRMDTHDVRNARPVVDLPILSLSDGSPNNEEAC